MIVELMAYLYAGWPPVEGVDSEIRALSMEFFNCELASFFLCSNYGLSFACAFAAASERHRSPGKARPRDVEEYRVTNDNSSIPPLSLRMVIHLCAIESGDTGIGCDLCEARGWDWLFAC